MKLRNKTAIVTGANRSIGRSIAHLFAQEGAAIAISYRSDEVGARRCVELIEGTGQKAVAIQADFSDVKQVPRFFEQAVAFLGEIDILVNCAAGYDTTGFLNLDVKTFDHLLQVGVVGPMALTQLVAKQMCAKKRGGSIINISSISGIAPYPNRTAHSTAKAALNMLTRVTALELAPYGIRVNAIAPGATPYDSDETGMATDSIPLGRVGTPEDQAKAALYLASEDSSWMTGHVMVIDGGQSLSFG
jgi:NAD(P)-dependent dehydrogenase (short-subunit alcohol dehydrogenase family)